jgi:hypothetical protein
MGGVDPPRFADPGIKKALPKTPKEASRQRKLRTANKT